MWVSTLANRLTGWRCVMGANTKAVLDLVCMLGGCFNGLPVVLVGGSVCVGTGMVGAHLFAVKLYHLKAILFKVIFN